MQIIWGQHLRTRKILQKALSDRRMHQLQEVRGAGIEMLRDETLASSSKPWDAWLDCPNIYRGFLLSLKISDSRSY